MQKERDYEKQHHANALLKGPANMVHTAQDVSLAAHVGQPNLNPPDDAVAASEVLKPNAGGASNFSLSTSVSTGDSVNTPSAGADTRPTKQEDASTSQTTVEPGPGGGTILGVQIIQPRDTNATNGANPPAAGTDQTAPPAAAAQPAANPADSTSPATTPTGTTSNTPAAANGQQAGTQPAAQTDQSSTDSSSSGQTATSSQNSSSDDSKDSTSKKKKGARKLIPW
jgi:hypothetical protein